MSHEPSLDLSIREENETYNRAYIESRGIPDAEPVARDDLPSASSFKAHAHCFMTVWLKNIDRLIERAEIDCRDYHFLDVGCGKGVAALYARDRFPFASVGGFDFSADLISAARRNRESSGIPGEIDFSVADAGEIELYSKRWFLFLFNPFGREVMNLFLVRNHTRLVQTESIMGYANYQELETVEAFDPKSVKEIAEYRCAVIRF